MYFISFLSYSFYPFYTFSGSNCRLLLTINFDDNHHRQHASKAISNVQLRQQPLTSATSLQRHASITTSDNDLQRPLLMSNLVRLPLLATNFDDHLQWPTLITNSIYHFQWLVGSYTHKKKVKKTPSIEVFWNTKLQLLVYRV